MRKIRVGAFSTNQPTSSCATVASTPSSRRQLHELASLSRRCATAQIATTGPFVVADLRADFDPAVHTLLLERLFPRQADVITSDALAQL